MITVGGSGSRADTLTPSPLASAAPALLIHDQQDREVSVDCTLEYAAGRHDAKLMTTRGLGDVRILRDAGVIAEVMRFIGAGRN